jgi:hypothetical protein
MTLNADLLVREADRLVDQAERRLVRYRAVLQKVRADAPEREALQSKVHKLNSELQRLELYRAVVKSAPSPHKALQPEYLYASGYVRRKPAD